MGVISSFVMNLRDVSASGESRDFTINGDVDSKFYIQAIKTTGEFYNWITQQWAVGFNSKNNFEVTLTGGAFVSSVVFPATTGEYFITLFSIPGSGTTFAKSTGAGDINILRKKITQVANSTLTFNTVSTSSSDNYDATVGSPTTVTSSPTTIQPINNAIDWDIKNTSDNSFSYGLRLIRQPLATDWYFETTDTVNGAISSATEVVVDDLTDLSEGMTITGVSGGSLSGTPSIVSINTETNTLTLSSAQTFADGITLTIRAYGAGLILDACGAGITIGDFTATEAALTKTVRTDTNSTTINLNGTYGISGGGHVTVGGLNVINTASNTVQSVSASSSAGSIVVEISQTAIPQGVILHFTGSTRTITLKGDITINQMPSSNRTISLNLDNFITVGTAS